MERKDKLPADIINNKLKSLGYERLSGAVTSDSSRVEIKCLTCKHKTIMNWSMIRGTCKNCYHIKQIKTTYNKVVEKAKEKGYTISHSFDEYLINCKNKTTTRNSLVKIKSLCPNGHVVEITSASASKVKWRCIECVKKG